MMRTRATICQSKINFPIILKFGRKFGFFEKKRSVRFKLSQLKVSQMIKNIMDSIMGSLLLKNSFVVFVSLFFHNFWFILIFRGKKTLLGPIELPVPVAYHTKYDTLYDSIIQRMMENLQNWGQMIRQKR